MQFRRSAFLINTNFQLRFSLYVCSWLFALSLAYPLIIYNLFMFFLKYMATDPQGPTAEGLMTMRKEVLVLLVALQAIFLLVTFILSVFTSHRIAGPLFKLKRHFVAVGTGALDQEVHFRKRDHFQDVAQSFNEMLAGLRSIVEKRNQSIRSAIQTLESVKEKSKGDIEQHLDTAIQHLETALSNAPKNK